MTAEEYLTKWCEGKNFSEETIQQRFIGFAEAYHKAELERMLESAAEPMDLVYEIKESIKK